MKNLFILLIYLLISNNIFAQYGSQDYNQQGGYGQDQGTQNQPPKGKTGLERKGLMDSMDITDKTKLTEEEKCKTKCDMTFVQCYRLQTDRSKCYSVQQECLGKCGGGGQETGQDYGTQDQGQGQSGTLEFGPSGY